MLKKIPITDDQINDIYNNDALFVANMIIKIVFIPQNIVQFPNDNRIIVNFAENMTNISSLTIENNEIYVTQDV